MKPRSKIQPAGTGPRYSSATVKGEAHGFRQPVFSIADRVALFCTQEAAKATAPKQSASWLRQVSTGMCAVIGACWHHEAMELDAQFPGARATDEQLAAFGDAVCDELMDREYDLYDISELFNCAQTLINLWTTRVAEATERADFSEAERSKPEAAAAQPPTAI